VSDAKVFKLTGIACQSQLISCSSLEPDAWVPFADHIEVVNAMKEKMEAYRNAVAILNSHIDKLTHAGNRLSIRTGQFACAKHYQPELKGWADVISESRPPQ